MKLRTNYQLMNEEGHSWWLYSDLEGEYFKKRTKNDSHDNEDLDRGDLDFDKEDEQFC